MRLTIAGGPAFQAEGEPSAARVIATHSLVGAGAGLLVGVVLRNAAVADEKTSVLLTWTALGLGAGVVSGVITWLVGWD